MQSYFIERPLVQRAKQGMADRLERYLTCHMTKLFTLKFAFSSKCEFVTGYNGCIPNSAIMRAQFGRIVPNRDFI